jgi:hypothetical protein
MQWTLCARPCGLGNVVARVIFAPACRCLAPSYTQTPQQPNTILRPSPPPSHLTPFSHRPPTPNDHPSVPNARHVYAIDFKSGARMVGGGRGGNIFESLALRGRTWKGRQGRRNQNVSIWQANNVIYKTQVCGFNVNCVRNNHYIICTDLKKIKDFYDYIQ